MTSNELLDADELMHVALQASERSDSGAAIEYLKRLLALQPDNPQALYLLGAQQAQIGLYDRARASIARALTLRPDIDVARFQLGYLELNASDVAAAEQTWQPLEALGEQHPFVLFKSALLHLSRNELAAAQACLEQGISANDFNQPLNTDMRKLVEVVKGRLQEASGQPAPVAVEGDAEVPTMFLEAYTTRKH